MPGAHAHIEIPVVDLPRYAERFRELVDDTCESRFFRASPKSCEFLRHVVQRSLEGTTDELKERLIGMTLFGREATYDTGSDATVRVRANDVRKRLTAYNEAHAADGKLRFELPAGSYVPRFYRAPATELASASVPAIVAIPSELRLGLVPLSLQCLAVPTLCALFLCVMCLRWQVAQEHPFMTFWQGVFRDGNVSLYLAPARVEGEEGMVGLRKLEASSPLLNLAAQFHSRLTVVDKPQATGSGLVIIVDDPPQHGAPSPASLSGEIPTKARLEVEDTAEGIRVVDRVSATHAFLGGPAALVTIERTPQRRISIEGTDTSAISSVVRTLCERDSFPDVLAETNDIRGTTQVVIPIARDAQPIVLHESNDDSTGPTGGAI